METLSPQQFQKVAVPLFKQVAKCLSSSHFQVLLLWRCGVAVWCGGDRGCDVVAVVVVAVVVVMVVVVVVLLWWWWWWWW